MAISAVSSVLEKINCNYQTESFIRRQVVCRALWFLLIPLETIALISQIARLILIDYSTKPLCLLVNCAVGLPSRVTIWANKFEAHDTKFNIFILTVGTTSSAIAGFISPSGNYNFHKNLLLRRKISVVKVNTAPVELAKQPETPAQMPVGMQTPPPITIQRTPQAPSRHIANQMKPPSPEEISKLTPGSKEYVIVDQVDTP